MRVNEAAQKRHECHFIGSEASRVTNFGSAWDLSYDFPEGRGG